MDGEDMDNFLERSKLRLDELRRRNEIRDTSDPMATFTGISRPIPTGISIDHKGVDLDYPMKSTTFASPGKSKTFASPHDNSETGFMPVQTSPQYIRTSTVMPAPSQLCQLTPPLMKPSTYDGSTPLTDYLTQFDIVSELNNWHPHTKAQYLAGMLRGDARGVLSDLDPSSQRCLPALVNALKRRFCSGDKEELNRTLLKNRVREKGESLPELAQNLRRLTKFAYPEAPSTIQDSLAKDQFLDAINDTDLRWRIFQSRPKTLDDTLEVAVECEAFHKAECQRSFNRPCRAVAVGTVESTAATENPDSKKTDELLSNLTEIVKSLKDSLPSRSNKGANDNAGQRPRRKCFKCGKPGHIQKYCRSQATAWNTQSPQNINHAAQSGAPNMHSGNA